MKNPILLIILLGLSLVALGCSKTDDEGKVVSVEEQKKMEAASPQNIQNANIPTQAKAAALHGQEMGKQMGQAMNQNRGR